MSQEIPERRKTPERKATPESELAISHEKAKQAYLAKDMETFGAWVNQEQERQPEPKEAYHQLFFEKRLGDIQIAAEQFDDAIERFNDLANRARTEYEGLQKNPPADISRDEVAERSQEMLDFEAACDEQVRELKELLKLRAKKEPAE